MTDLEIKYVKDYLSYLKTEYKINISHEDFIYDVDTASLVRDTATLSVNYSNYYKKYLRIISKEAYKEYFSFSNYKGSLKCYEHKVVEILLFYELMMSSILTSSIFIEYSKDMAVAEKLFAGINSQKYCEIIGLDGFSMTSIDEMKRVNPLLNSVALCDELHIKMHGYKNAENKNEAFKRISLIYCFIENDYKHSFKIGKRLKIKKATGQYIKFMTKELGISKKELIQRMKNNANELGNYSKCISDVKNIFGVGKTLRDLRNQFEEDEELFDKYLNEFKIDMVNGIYKSSLINKLKDFEINEKIGGEENV